MVYLSIEGRLDRECLGLYTIIEDIDTKAFLKEHFGSAKGLLLKPWSIRGLPYLGEQWGAYESRYAARSEVTEEAAQRTIEFIKLVNYGDDETFGRKIGEYLNVEEFLRLLGGGCDSGEPGYVSIHRAQLLHVSESGRQPVLFHAMGHEFVVCEFHVGGDGGSASAFEHHEAALGADAVD